MRYGFTSVDRLLHRLDRLVISGLAALIVLTPLAIGAVNRGAIITMELTIFALAIIWMVRSTINGITPASNSSSIRAARLLSLPFLALALLLLIQLVPMPPQMLRLVSPGAYRVYQIAFPRWPYGEPHLTSLAISPAGRALSLSSPPWPPPHSRQTQEQRAPSSISTRAVVPPTARANRPRWRPLTLSPGVTSACLIEFLALGSAFFLVWVYPFGPPGERGSQQTALRAIVYIVVGTAATVALLGIAERAWWNGKILWFYQPVDWSGPLIAYSPRASGPFVNPDHFANYLALTLPLATAGALFPLSFIRTPEQPTLRMLFAGSALLMLTAVMLSLSRGGALASCVGIASMLAMSYRWAPAHTPAILQRLGLRAVSLSLVTFALMVGLTIYLMGAPSRSAVGDRLSATPGDDFAARAGVWRETLTMIGEFPLLGVGAGAWPEVFPRYQPPPKSRYFFSRTAENDYLQFISENGIIGLLILLLFAGLLIRGLTSAAPRIPSHRWPLFAALLGGILGGLVQEFVDASLHIPANALLFTILLALMLRVAFADQQGERGKLKVAQGAAHSSILPILSAVGALLLMIAAWQQDGSAYPYHLDRPSDLAAVESNLLWHPSMAAAHVALAQQMPANAVEPQLEQLSAATWLDPNQALARDLLARNLLLSGNRVEALRQITDSVYRAPFLELHYYLAPAAIPWLLPEEQYAIAHGFDRAVESDFIGAADELASFYLMLGRERDAADTYWRAAQIASSNLRRFDFLLKAGQEYARIRDYARGGEALLDASRLAPADSRPYSVLAQDIYGPQNQLARAGATINQGIQNGADPYTLEMALANAAENAGNHPSAEAALTQALGYELTFEAILRLGQVYFADGRFNRAVATLQQAVQINPNSADGFLWLGRAHEANYDYYEASRAYRQATSLAPTDRLMREQYRDFERRTAEGEQPTRQN
jgi:tetratricopeptide (TPR) repeat protein